MVIKKSENDAHINDTETKIKARIQDIQVKVLKRIFRGIACPLFGIAQKYFYPDYYHVNRRRDKKK